MRVFCLGGNAGGTTELLLDDEERVALGECKGDGPLKQSGLFSEQNLFLLEEFVVSYLSRLECDGKHSACVWALLLELCIDAWLKEHDCAEDRPVIEGLPHCD